jgi:hypothetical protein
LNTSEEEEKSNADTFHGKDSDDGQALQNLDWTKE